MSDWLDAETHADRALEMFERGRWAEAETELRKAISLNPDQAEWHYNLGLTLEAAGRDVESLGCFAKTADLMPDLVEPLLAAGAACHRLQQHRDGLGWYDRAIRLDRANEAAHAGRIDAFVHLGQHDEAETAFYLAQQSLEDQSAACLAAISESLIERSEWGRAGWCLREAMRLEPTMPRLPGRLAAVLVAQGQSQRALQLYLRELRDDPGSLDTLLDYGDLLVSMGRLSEAAEKFRRVLELEPANVEAHERLGRIAFDLGQFEKAHLEFELVLKLDPSFPRIRLSLADAMLRRGQRDAARSMLRDELDAIARHDSRDESRPRDRDTNGNDAATPILPADADQLASLLLEADLAVDAAAVLDQVGAARSEVPARLRMLALARFRSDDRTGGAMVARRVLRYDPTCIASMHNLALTALDAGLLPVAAGWIHRGLRVDRHDTGLRRLRMRLTMAMVRKTVRSWMKRVLPVGG